MRFSVLGPLEVSRGERVYTPKAAKPRQLLALLQMRANQIVHVDTLIEELWGEKPPRSAMTTTQTYIYQLRKALREELGVSDPEHTLMTCTPGYMLCVEGDELDAAVFERSIVRGREALLAGRVAEAAESLREALAMSSGPALANVSLGRFLQGYVTQLEELRTAALEMRIHADMRLGRHQDLISELSSLVCVHPLNEALHAQLIRALSRSGRRGDALRAYERTRQILDRELGLEPSDELRRLQREVLCGGRPREDLVAPVARAAAVRG